MWLPAGSRVNTGVHMKHLNQINYPTGGKTVFDYELNDYGKYLNDNRQILQSGSGKVGGLRVRKITNVDNDGKSVSKEIFYVNGYTNTGILSTLSSSGVLERKPEIQLFPG